MARKLGDPQDLAKWLEEIKERASLRKLETTSSTDFSSNLYSCSKCQDTGTITEIVTEEKIGPSGQKYRQEFVRTDENGRVPLCDCHTNKLYAEKYNPSVGLKPHEKERTFETACIDNENGHFFSQALNFVKSIDTHLKSGTWLYIYGDKRRAEKLNLSAYGTGKSYLTHCITNELAKMKQKALYVTEQQLFQTIKSTYRKDSQESESEVLNRYHSIPILLIDDLFKSQYKDWAEDIMFHLLDARNCPGRVTIINSNYAPNRIQIAMERNGDAVESRIFGQAVLIEMIGTDRRKQKFPGGVP